MVEFLVQEFGERALNGDIDELELLRNQVSDLEAKLETQNAANTTAESKSDKAANSEDETDEDVRMPPFQRIPTVSKLFHVLIFRKILTTSMISQPKSPQRRTVVPALLSLPKLSVPGTKRALSRLRKLTSPLMPRRPLERS